VVASLYALFFFYATIEWLKTREFSVLPNYNVVKFSIIIPFRNEVESLKICIQSILEQHYSTDDYEIILVNDHSDDGSELIPDQYFPEHSNIILLDNKGSGKKEAILTGIKESKYAHIITVDADTSRGRSWLASFASMFNYKGVQVVAGGVLMVPLKSNPFHHFQSMDYCGMMALSMIAMRKHWFRNGSGGNLGFTKDVYAKYLNAEVDKDIHSGDDVFLLHQTYQKGKDNVIFPKSKEILAYTFTEKTWKSFMAQRSRWAAKSFNYKEYAMTLIWAFIWIANLLIPTLFIFSIIYGGVFIQLLTYSLGTKLLADLIFLKSATNYFDKGFFKYFFIAELYHLSYVILVGINALLGRKFEWKGTKIKR